LRLRGFVALVLGLKALAVGHDLVAVLLPFLPHRVVAGAFAVGGPPDGDHVIALEYRPPFAFAGSLIFFRL
jgi:hypothetical protein